MGIATGYHDYQRYDPPRGVGGRCSPALVQLQSALRQRYGTGSLGCYGVRPIRGGTLRSTHSFGAAIDIALGGIDPAVEEHVIAYLVGNSGLWGVQMVVDYQRSRIWKAGRTPDVADACTKWWKAQRPDSSGMGQSWARWLHVEVHPSSWAAEWTESQRGIS